MQTVFHLVVALLGFCIAVASSLPLADGVLSSTAQELGSPSLPTANIAQGTPDKRASSNITKVDEDAGGAYTCFGKLEALPSDCSTLVASLAKNTGTIYADAHQCVGFTSGACVAKWCSNEDSELQVGAEWFASQVSLLSGCTSGSQNGVMAPCSDDSFQGSCAWWQIWLQSPNALETQGGGGD
ncbi:hypothetical protein PG985_006571 [Apiospora marii]|uniref:Secreted protein n=1 Tax=Apiospora marii TaxID=335849 RepID=A0ABR1S865_9PEZI